MRCVIQCAREAAVRVDSEVVGALRQPGYVVLVGFSADDTNATIDKMLQKLIHLRILPDEKGRTNCSLEDVGGDVLLVSQFTLYANCKRGLRPSFTDAAPGPLARERYEYMLKAAAKLLGAERVSAGIFGAHMEVELTNSGPFTVLLDSNELGF